MAFIPADTAQDVAFGITLAVAGFEIVSSAIKKAIASAVVFFVAAASAYGLFYL